MTPGALASVADRIRSRPGTYRTPCPKCDRGTHDRALAVTIEPDGGVVWMCHRCNWAGGSRGAHTAPSPRPARPAQQVRSPEAAMALYAASRPIEPGSVAADYLLARGCALPPAGGDLRWHPSVRHMSGHIGPALVALVTHAKTGEPLSVHRTWIDPARPGRKSDIDPPRTYWPGLPTRGGAVRLWADDAVSMGLALGEGIETALALAHAFAPVWAALDAGHLADFPVLPGIECLTIAADHDDAGLKAARECADHWSEAGVEVHVVASSTAGWDVTDEAAA